MAWGGSTFCTNTGYEWYELPSMFWVDAVTIPCEFGVSTITPWHICSPTMNQEISQLPKFINQQIWSKWHEEDPLSANTQDMNDQNYLLCLEWMLKPFHVGLGPQPAHLDIHCTPLWLRNTTTNSLKCRQIKIWRKWHEMVHTPTAYPLHMNDMNCLLCLK